MRHAHIALLVALSFPCAAAFGDPCYVTNAAALQTALNNQCQHIIVDVGEVIVVGQPITINSGNNGLQLTIDGTIEWGGDAGCANCKLFEISGATGITISGTGKFWTPPPITFPNPDPGFPSPQNPNGKDLPIAMAIYNGTDIEIDGLEFVNLGWIINQVYSPTFGHYESNNLRFKNLIATEMWDYGIWLGKANGVLIENCHLGNSQGAWGVHRFHGFRLYGDDINVYNCSGYNIQRTPLWRVHGVGSTIDGFVADEGAEPIRIGPNFSCLEGADSGQRTKEVFVNNITAPALQIELGTIGCRLINIDSVLGIGREIIGDVVPRPVERIWWTNVTNADYVVTGCFGPNIGEFTCLTDITRDGVTNVNDLLAVINNWGNCWSDSPLGGTCESLPPCDTPAPCLAADIDTIWGDGTINVNDLLAVLTNWGTCVTPSSPSSVYEDCIDYVTNVLELDPETKAWAEAYEDCVESNGGFAE